MSAREQDRRPVTDALYLHVGTGDRYRVEACVGEAVWLRRVADRNGLTPETRHCTPLMCFATDFVSVEAAEGLLVVLGLFEVMDTPADHEPVPYRLAHPSGANTLDAEVARLAEQLADDAALEEWLAGPGREAS